MILIEKVEHLDEVLPQEEDTVFIFDEADLLIERSLVNFNDKQLGGIFAFRNEKCYLFTATLEDYWKKCWEAVIFKQTEVIPFETSRTVVRGQ